MIYTNRVYFSFGSAAFGRIEARLLREKAGQSLAPRKVELTPLLPFAKNLLLSMLSLSDQVATAVIAYLKTPLPTKTHAICGVYVPALHRLASYEIPSKSTELQRVADCQEKCGDYLRASECGFPNGHWWRFLIALSERFGSAPGYVGPFHEGGVSDALLNWKMIFVRDGKKLGVVARDLVNLETVALEQSGKELSKFFAEAKLTRAVIVSRHGLNSSSWNREANPQFPIVVLDNPGDAARAVFDVLTQ